FRRMEFSFRDNNACEAPKPGQDSLLKKDIVGNPEAKTFDNKAGEKTDGSDGCGFLSRGQTGSQFQGAPEKTLSTDASGFSKPAMNMSANMNVVMDTFQSSKPPSLTEPQKTLHVAEPSKPFQASSKPSDTSPHVTSDNSAEVCGNLWTGEELLSTKPPSKPEQSPTKPLGIQGCQDQDTTSEKEANERGQQKRKNECDDMEEMHGLLESLRSPEKALSKNTHHGGSSPPSPGESWKSEIKEWGGGRIQAKKSKSRTKIPEEWASESANTSSSAPPPEHRHSSMITDTDICTASTISNEQGSALTYFMPDTVPLTTTSESVAPTASQINAISQSTILDPCQSTPVVTASLLTSPHFTSDFKTSGGSIPSPQKSTASLNISTMFVPTPPLPVTSSTVVSQNPAASASLTSLTKHQEPPLAKYPQLQDGKDKTEKVDATPKMDNSGLTGKADKPMKIEKIESSVKKVENVSQKGSEEKVNGNERVDKTAKNEKNKKDGREIVEGAVTADNGNKELISPETKAKADKQNSTKPNLHSAGENSSNKKGPALKTTPITGTKKPSGTTPAREAKNTENSAPPQRKPPVPKFNGSTKNHPRTASAKTSLRTTPASSTVNTNASASPPTNGTSTPRPSRITKPPVPKQVPLPRKLPVPRAPRNTRLPNAPLPDLKNVSSKIGSTDNMKYQPGGGKIQIVHKKLDFSHVTSRCGSKDNIKHIPGGGNVQILNKKVDVSKVTAKCGSKDNTKHNTGKCAVDAKVECHKTDINTKDNGGSPDSVSHKPGGSQIKVGEEEEKSGGSPSAPAAKPPIQTDKGAKENGLKEGSSAVPSVGGALLNSQGLEKHIPVGSKSPYITFTKAMIS
ncbi:hypothetical protein NFI96_029874, partial [Prochilodus magdalenae]